MAIKKHILISCLMLFSALMLWAPIQLFSQSGEDSLLKQISEIEFSLDEPVDSEEDLYMNSVSFQSFYDVLSPMGEWIQITKEDVDEDLNEGEGQSFSSLFDDGPLYIWKPSVESGWKPYMNGKWEYTDHGWLWISADKWGNSTYNYGRWWNSPKYGWVWMPGYTWAPAWVKWKVTGNHVGWVALNPKAKWNSENGITDGTYRYKNSDNDWVFVSDNNFAGEINSLNITPENENSALVKAGNDIMDITTQNDKIINKGPDAADMERRTGKPYKQKKIKFSRDKNTVIGNDDIVIGREKFKKDNEHKIKDKPGNFKKSDRVKKVIKRNKNNKPNIKRKGPKK